MHHRGGACRRLSLLAQLAAALVGTEAAAQATLQLDVDRRLLAPGEAIQVTVTVKLAGSTSLGDYTAPPLPGFSRLGRTMRSQQMRVDSFNMQVERTDSYTYSALAEREGQFTLGPAAVSVGGRTFRSNTVEVTVRGGAGASAGSGAQPPPAAGAPHGAQQAPDPGAPAPDPERPPEVDGALPSVFVDASVTPKTVYVGQQVVATWRLYTQVSISDYDFVKEPVAEGFWSENLGTQRLQQLEQQVVQGRVYYAGTLLRRAFFPQRAGTLEISELEVRLELPSRSFFFDRSEARKSKPVSLEVLPLPSAGRPANFAPQNVGQFDVAATLDRDEVEVGEAVKLTLTVRGTGNLRQLALPEAPRVSGLKVYEPKISENLSGSDAVSGEKVAVYLLVPTEPGLVRVPPLRLDYFDPLSRRYRQAETSALALRATGKAVKDGPNQSSASTTNVIGPDIRPPRPPRALEHRPAEPPVSVLHLVLLTLPLAGFLLLSVGERLRAYVSKPTPKSQEKAAARRVRQQLARAAEQASSSNAVACFSAVAAAINGQLRHQLQRAVEGMTRDELRHGMLEAGFRDDVVADTLRQLERCDAARFAPSSVAHADLEAALEQARRLVREIAAQPAARAHRARGAHAALLAAAVFLAASSARAETVQGSYEQALKAYYAGKYELAVEQLERLVVLPLHDEELFYNLGNAYYRWGKLGHAIYNYERALARAPDFEDASFNLALARRQADRRVKDVLKGATEEPLWSSAVKAWSLDSWWSLVIALWWLVLGLTHALRRVGHGPARAAIVALNGMFALLLLVAGLALASRIRLVSAAPEGIILSDRVAAREGPDPSARETFKFHAGLKVRVKDESAGWARVRLPNGLEGWVERRAVGVL